MDQIHKEGISAQGDPGGYSSLKGVKCTLVPDRFFNEDEAADLLSEVQFLEDDDQVSHVNIPEYGAELVYAGDGLPELYFILKLLPSCPEYNKIVASHKDGYLHLAIAQGGSLQIANSYRAQDFTTALYFLFLAMKTLQLNPEVSTIVWRTALTPEDEMTLYRYFKAVEQL